jgi:sec-independent protein translocase protein TatA
MGAFSIWHWLIVLVVVLVLFGGKGKISSLMGDFGKGLKSFKRGMKEEEKADDNSEVVPKALNAEQAETLNTAAKKDNAAKT